MKSKRSRVQDIIVSFDKGILFSYIGLCLIGLLVMLDITSMQSSMQNFYRHLVFLGLSFVTVVVVLYFFNLQKLRFLNKYMILAVILLLILVLVQKTEVKGATRGLRLGFINLQPSFLARFALIFFFAGFLENKEQELRNAGLKEFLIGFMPLVLYTIVIFVLVFMEKHLSTLIIGGATLLGMLVYAGMKKRLIVLILGLGLVAGALVILKGEEYRSDRLKTFLTYNLFVPDRPEPENSSKEYQVRESLTALTSGGLLGMGVSRGRAKHYFLPEARTDYIYTIIGEEFGFLGAFLVLALHALIFFKAFKLAERQENAYYKYLCAGLAMNIFLNALVNTGVAMSILPSTGNTLPFISYGGTALLVDSASIGVILNISTRRRQL